MWWLWHAQPLVKNSLPQNSFKFYLYLRVQIAGNICYIRQLQIKQKGFMVVTEYTCIRTNKSVLLTHCCPPYSLHLKNLIIFMWGVKNIMWQTKALKSANIKFSRNDVGTYVLTCSQLQTILNVDLICFRWCNVIIIISDLGGIRHQQHGDLFI